MTTQKSKDVSVSVLIDPFFEGTGLRSPKLDSDILVSTRKGQLTKETGSFLINSPGEYDVSEIYIGGISLSEKLVGYRFEIEGIRLLHLGLLDKKELTPQDLEQISDVDILIIPIGGKDSIDATTAMKIMSQIEPIITIPIYYKIKGLKDNLDGLDKFFKLLGVKPISAVSKLSVKKKDMSKDEAKIVILEP